MWSVVKSAGAISTRKQVPFFHLVLLWLFVVTAIGSTAIWAIEAGVGSDVHDDLGGSNETDGLDSSTVLFADSFFVALNGVTATGLSALDLSRLHTGSKWALMLCVQLGSATMLSTIPVWTRVRSLRKILPPGTRFDLRTFSEVPQWLVEYKALVFLLRIVFCYQLFVHLFWGTLMYILIATDPPLAAQVESQCPQGLFFFVVFEVVSAYCNAGFSLLKSGDIRLFR
jgi:Trk-type K+ transport system membrane component